MLELLKPFYGVILKYSAISLGILLVLFKVHQSGIETVERKDAMQTLKALQEREKIKNNLNNCTNDKLNELYDKIVKRD